MDAQALLVRVYDAYNRRDFEALAAFMTPDIDWPNQIEGGRVVGRETVKAYWLENDKSIRGDVAPVTFVALPDGRMAVDVNQIIRNLGGQIWSDSCVRQIFTLREGLVARMDIELLDRRS
jgi:hypothetical protein